MEKFTVAQHKEKHKHTCKSGCIASGAKSRVRSKNDNFIREILHLIKNYAEPY